MKNLTLILCIALLSCNSEQTKTPELAYEQPQQEFGNLNTFLKNYDVQTQSFTVAADKKVRVVGKKGTVISVSPGDLETESGEPAGKEVTVHLKEIMSSQDLLRANAPTVSDGSLLISGGAFYIDLSSGGKKLKLKEGKTYSVEFPKNSDDEMSLFYGQRDSSGSMNWKRAGQKFESPEVRKKPSAGYRAIVITGSGKFADTVSKDMKNVTAGDLERMRAEDSLTKRIYSPVALNQFGWINCDRFMNPGTITTNFRFTLSNKPEEVNFASVRLIFDDIKSMLQTPYYVYNNKTEGNYFDRVPVNASVRILAVSYQHEKIFATLTDAFKIKANQQESFTLREMSSEEFEKLIWGI